MISMENKNMTTKHALQTLCEIAELDIRSYSGRSMYGRECLAVDGDLGAIFGALVLTAAENRNFTLCDEEDLRIGLASVRTDSMGMGSVVYFPNVAFCGDEGKDELDEAASEDEDGHADEDNDMDDDMVRESDERDAFNERLDNVRNER
jgi:hypothetical protein